MGDGIITRRALVMSGIYDSLIGGDGYVAPASVTCMQNACLCNGITTYSYIQAIGDTPSDFLSAITTSLSSTDDDDISYVFINTHGDCYGNLLINGVNSSYQISLSTLKNTLDTINGHIILMLSACYSGNAIIRDSECNDDNNGTSSLSEQYINLFLYDSDIPPRSGEFLNNTKYAVLCSCLNNQFSYCFSGCTYAARFWATGLGFIVINGLGSGTYYYLSSLYRPCDLDYNSLVTIKELNDYSNQELSIHYSYAVGFQTFCCYAASPYYTIVTDDYLLGDVNQSDSLSMIDVLYVTQHVNGINPLSGRSLELADIDCDGYVDSTDINLLRVLVTMG